MVLSAPLRCKAKEISTSINDLKGKFTYRNGKLFYTRKNKFKNTAVIVEAGNFHHTGYRWVRFMGKNFAASRVIWALHNGRWPDGVIDHINGIKDDNRIENLRDVCERVNQINTYAHRAGSFPGVCERRGKTPRRKKWGAYAPAKFLNRDKPSKKLIASFATKEEAIICVISFCYFGEWNGKKE